MTPSIAIVGLACRYPDARSPFELWENVLSQRRAFRRIPPERLRVEDYLTPNHSAPDSFYSAEAAVIEGYEFDRLGFRVAGETYRTADMAHWLALDVAAQALTDGGFGEGRGLPLETTAVFLGNTLTGEFSRANVLRLRWPYVRRVIEASLVEEQWPAEQRAAFLKKLEAAYKKPFPATGEETLAGGLSNTIAGRICNHFDLKGGGYTIDGACASSLLAVANACSALTAGDVDVALAGGCDLSLDPFELVGFARAGALAADEMRVYDARSNGFWPGEGCGFAVLMRTEDARAQDRRIYATLRGWGISSDGHGGIMRPDVEGQTLALERAYRRAGFGIETVAYFEGHGTGTGVGDTTELKALSQARRQSAGAATSAPAAIGSIKANIGHTKAAAGVAGLIKATLAVEAGILPPTTGCGEPHSELRGEAAQLMTLTDGARWPDARPRRAGVSAMGFGGINVHVVIEGTDAAPQSEFSHLEKSLLSSPQDCELFMLAGPDVADLRRQVERLSSFAARLSRAELADLAAQLERGLAGDRPARAAVVAASPAQLSERLSKLETTLAGEAATHLDAREGVFFSRAPARPRLGFLFPGQGSPSHTDGGALCRRFEAVRHLYESANLATSGDRGATEVAQPAIVTASLAALRVLDRLDLRASLAVGHSLGELTALHWAGALEEAALLRIARVRGRAMAEAGDVPGAMASVAAGRREVEALINGDRVVIAGVNAPSQTILSGELSAVETVLARARARQLSAVRLPVSHAFHSPLVAAAEPILAAQLAREEVHDLRRPVVSTVTGLPLETMTDLRALLRRQVTAPVLFMDAVARACEEGVDLWIEVGPGVVLGRLVAGMTGQPAISLDAGGASLEGLLTAAGAAFALGSKLNHAALFSGRFVRPFNLDWRPRFFTNPCELAPQGSAAAEAFQMLETFGASPAEEAVAPPPLDSANASTLDLITELVAARCEMPASALRENQRFLSDLHLNSITVSTLVAEAARRLGLPRPEAPTDFADATLFEVAGALDEQRRAGLSSASQEEETPAGVDSWIRPFTVELVERPQPRRQSSVVKGVWQVIAPQSHALAEKLRQSLADRAEGKGVIICLPPDPEERHIPLLLDGVRAIAEDREGSRFILVQHGGGAASFARTLQLELPEVIPVVIDLPPDHPQAPEWVIAEALAATRYTEVSYDADGRRREPVWRHLPVSETSAGQALGADDVLLVTGGGKGITAECALSLAKSTGTRLALIGQARPEADAELAENLRRMSAAGVRYRYYSVDIADRQAVSVAVAQIEAELGVVTGMLHGAARNSPRLLAAHDAETFRRTLEVKVGGARNLLAAINPERLRLFITFGSIIARTGLPGEADYALANEWLTRLAERWQAEHPHCRCLALEWSVWSGVGMGERLGSMDTLRQQGISPITPDKGVEALQQLLGAQLPSVAVIVAGRYKELPTFRLEERELPFMRFLERPRVYYPGIELVADVDLSADADPYLDDHQLQGERLLPAVVGLEAMAQVASALVGSDDPPASFEKVFFARPVVVPKNSTLTVRLAGLVREPGVVEVALRSEETAFQLDHFSAICRFASATREKERGAPATDGVIASGSVALDPARDLYGDILFHSGRFRRLKNYRLLRATECLAELTPDDELPWFSLYLPARLLLGNPARRDAVIHAIQACIPHATLLPVGVDSLRFGPGRGSSAGPCFVHAREVQHAGNLYIYDVQLLSDGGEVRESWQGLRLRLVGNGEPRNAWAEALLGPYLERRVRELIASTDLAVALRRDDGGTRAEQSNQAIRLALGECVPVFRRADGKPEAEAGRQVSSSHCGDLTLAAAGDGIVACDVEPVADRDELVWRDLLGGSRFALAGLIARHAREDEAAARTRIWTAAECLKKAGASAEAPLLYRSATADGWTLLASGQLVIATYVTQVKETGERLALSLLAGQGWAPAPAEFALHASVEGAM